MLPSRKEQTILKLLIEHGSMYGLQMVETSGGDLARGTVYVTLSRMQDKGFVECRREDPRPEAIGPPRRIYSITGHGQRALEACELVAARLSPAGAT